MKKILQKLIDHHDLNQKEIEEVLELALKQEHSMQVAAFLALMEAKKITADELIYVLQYLQTKSVLVNLSYPVLDIVGTGGDYANTFNISTGSAILAAACGIKVAKHGNRSVSSNCGSADVLEELGILLEQNPASIKSTIDEVGIAFMYAPIFNPAIQAVKEVRSSLGIRTLFNLLGPLLNPANAPYIMVGVYDSSLVQLVAQTFAKLKKNALVFCSNGMDEITTTATVQAKIIRHGKFEDLEINPMHLGFERCSLKDLHGKDKSYNAKELLMVFQGKKGPWADTLIINAAAALFLCAKVETLNEGVMIAQEKLEKGEAYRKLKQWIEYSNRNRGI